MAKRDRLSKEGLQGVFGQMHYELTDSNGLKWYGGNWDGKVQLSRGYESRLSLSSDFLVIITIVFSGTLYVFIFCLRFF